jgi:hypothetical protein
MRVTIPGVVSAFNTVLVVVVEVTTIVRIQHNPRNTL